jgi:steroid delta-isomerase-like uncharacterized protein
MSVEENVALARLFLAEEDKRGVPPAELCAPGFTALIAGFPPMDLAGVTDLAKVFYGAFPDIQQTIEDVLADEDKAALRFSATGTHQGDLMGTPPTGKQIKISGMAIFHIAEGKVTEWAEVFDQMTLMQQIGAIPVPGQQEAPATA